MSLLVKSAGTYSILVDEGRPHHRRWGLPESGPADRLSFRLANALVGNPRPLACLEISLSGPRLLALHDTGFACVGGTFSLFIDERPLPYQSAGTLRKGEILDIRGTTCGARCYLAVAKGFRSPSILNSQSAFAPIVAGGGLHCEESHCPTRWLSPSIFPARAQSLRVIRGPQAHHFDIPKIINQTYTVSPLGNRMGIRLKGPEIPVPEEQLVSEPVHTGAVQITADGQLVILGVEGQTIGGYHKPLHVISSDWDRLGQLRPNDPVTFELVTEQQAELLRDDYEAECHRLISRVNFWCDDTTAIS
jgi:biotin-dependent carboxylase-like uncharacterized protein